MAPAQKIALPATLCGARFFWGLAVFGEIASDICVFFCKRL
jgi:hypothetical protein